MKNKSHSLQKLSPIRNHPIKIHAPSRLNFPKPGDSNIYAGVGRKHFYEGMSLNPQPLQYYLQKQNSHRKIEFKERENSRGQQRKSSLPHEIYNNNHKTIINSPYLDKKNSNIFPSDSLEKMEMQYDLKKSPNKRQKLVLQAQQSPLKSNNNIKDPETLIKSAIYNNNNNTNATNVIKMSKFQNKIINPTFLSNINL